MNTEQITLLVPVLVPLILAAIKLLLPKVPSKYIPILAPLFGGLIDLACSGVLGVGTAWGAALGSAGVGVREIVDQWRKPVTPAKP